MLSWITQVVHGNAVVGISSEDQSAWWSRCLRMLSWTTQVVLGNAVVGMREAVNNASHFDVNFSNILKKRMVEKVVLIELNSLATIS